MTGEDDRSCEMDRTEVRDMVLEGGKFIKSPHLDLTFKFKVTV